MPNRVSIKFILSQTHTTLAGSRLYFHPSRNNLFVVAIGNELRRLMARSTAPRSTYPRISPPDNRGNIGVCDWQSPARVESVVHDFALPCAQTCPELLKRATLPPFPTAAILFLPMLMRDLDLHAKVVHTQNVGNGIRLMVAQIVNGVADAEVTQLVGCGLHGLVPSYAIVELVFYS